MMAVDEPIDWRARCVERFHLKPVPESWQDEDARGSEHAWKRYYKFRSSKEEVADDDDLISAASGEKELLEEWESNLEAEEDEVFDGGEYTWSAHLSLGDVTFEECDEVRTAVFYGHVWSPYVIPHVIKLEHRYHRRVRYSSREFYAVWSYVLLDFEEHDVDIKTVEDYTEICSNCFEDETLRADVISAFNLNQNTLNELRLFLFGAIDQTKQVIDDFNFVRLLFASMGTFDYETLKRGWIGYSWSIPYDNKELKQQMIQQGVIKKGDYPSISWLEYHMRKAANALRPLDNYYTPPTLRDAPGYQSPDDNFY